MRDKSASNGQWGQNIMVNMSDITSVEIEDSNNSYGMLQSIGTGNGPIGSIDPNSMSQGYLGWGSGYGESKSS